MVSSKIFNFSVDEMKLNNDSTVTELKLSKLQIKLSRLQSLQDVNSKKLQKAKQKVDNLMGKWYGK